MCRTKTGLPIPCMRTSVNMHRYSVFDGAVVQNKKKLKSAGCLRTSPVAMARSAESLAAAGVNAALVAQPVIRARFGNEELEVACVYPLT